MGKVSESIFLATATIPTLNAFGRAKLVKIKVRVQWRCYTRARQVKRPGWKIHHPGSALPIALRIALLR